MLNFVKEMATWRNTANKSLLTRTSSRGNTSGHLLASSFPPSLAPERFTAQLDLIQTHTLCLLNTNWFGTYVLYTRKAAQLPNAHRFNTHKEILQGFDVV